VARLRKQAQPVLLSLLKEGFSRQRAARQAGIDPATFYRWLKADEAFKGAVESAEAAAHERWRRG
jgi:hypothetical protein